MDLFAALGEGLSWLSGFAPRPTLLRSTEAAVRFGPRGNKTFTGPRFLWWIPRVWDLESTSTVRQVLDLPAQTLMTKDMREVVASGLVVYRVVDVTKFLVENHDADQSIIEMASAALRAVIVESDLATIQSNDRNKIDHRLTRSAKEALAEFGVEVERVRLSDFSTARTMNFVGGALAASYEEEDDE